MMVSHAEVSCVVVYVYDEIKTPHSRQENFKDHEVITVGTSPSAGTRKGLSSLLLMLDEWAQELL